MQQMGTISLACISSIVVLLAGCATGPSRLEASYGAAYHLARYHQILAPGAENNVEPVYGFDGVAAQATIEKYHTSFAKPPAPPAYVLSIGQIK